MFVPGLAAGLVSGAPQLGAGAAVATTAALGGTAIAGGMLAAGGAPPGGPRRGRQHQGRRLAHRQGRCRRTRRAVPRGVARTTVDRAGIAHDRVGHGARARRLPARRGARLPRCAAAIRPGDPGRGADALAPVQHRRIAPAWAQSLARRQRITQAGLVAAQALREGDRPASGGGPDLKDKS